jgi:hypothetical protein
MTFQVLNFVLFATSSFENTIGGTVEVPSFFPAVPLFHLPRDRGKKEMGRSPARHFHVLWASASS